MSDQETEQQHSERLTELSDPKIKVSAGAFDFSESQADPVAKELAKALGEGWQIKKQQRQWLFLFALGFIALLTIGFMVFAGVMLCLLFKRPNFVFDWHILLIGSTLILPPTVLLFLLANRIYADDHHKKPKGDDETAKEDSATSPINQLVQTCSELMKTCSELVGKLGKD